MKFLTQTKLNNPEAGVRGNCMMAGYAGYFDLKIEQAPAIEEMFDDPSVSWFQHLMDWLAAMGYEEVRHRKNGSPMDPSESGHDDYYFACGQSPRGISHMVIYKNGVMVHDPHPSRAGIVEPEEFITFKRIL